MQIKPEWLALPKSACLECLKKENGKIVTPGQILNWFQEDDFLYLKDKQKYFTAKIKTFNYEKSTWGWPYDGDQFKNITLEIQNKFFTFDLETLLKKYKIFDAKYHKLDVLNYLEKDIHVFS